MSNGCFWHLESPPQPSRLVSGSPPAAWAASATGVLLAPWPATAALLAFAPLAADPGSGFDS